MTIALELTGDAERILGIVRHNRDYLGSVVDEVYELDANLEARFITGRERDFDRALAGCVVRAGNAVESCAAINRLRADDEAWGYLWSKITEIVGAASRWPELALRMTAAAGRC